MKECRSVFWKFSMGRSPYWYKRILMTPIQPGLEVLGLAPRFEECISPVPRNDDPLLKMLGGHEPVIGMTPDPFPGDFRFFVRGILQWPQEGVIRSCITDCP